MPDSTHSNTTLSEYAQRLNDPQDSAEAIAAIVRRLQTWMKQMAADRLSDSVAVRESPSDITQETFVAFTKRVETGEYVFQTSGQVIGLLIEILTCRTDQAWRAHRGAQRRDTRRETAMDTTALTNDHRRNDPLSAEQLAFLNEEMELLKQRLQQLPGQQARIVQERLNGLEIKEIADLLSWSCARVRRQLELAIKALRPA